MNIHDSGYKRLFSNLVFFRQLVQTFVEDDWVQELDFSRAERVNKSFITEHYKETESDLIYKVPWRGKPVYFYVLLEFQSTIDPFMALRVLYYILGLYMDMRISHPVLEKLPAVFLIVLYNGDRRWNAAESIRELIEDQPDLKEQAIHFKYFKIAENEYALDSLLKIRNLVSTLFIAETHFDLEQLVEEVTALFEREADKSAASLLVNWLAQMAVHGRIEKSDFAALEQVYRHSVEVKTMLQTAIAREKEQILSQGKNEGKREQQRLSAQRMVEASFPLATIAFTLGLSEKEVQTLLSEAINEAE